MQSALFVCELEALHMSSSISAFQSCSKDGLVKTLWRNHSHEPKVSTFSMQSSPLHIVQLESTVDPVNFTVTLISLFWW